MTAVSVGTVVRKDTLQRGSKNWSKGLDALDEGDDGILAVTHEDDDVLHGWCHIERKWP